MMLVCSRMHTEAGEAAGGLDVACDGDCLLTRLVQSSRISYGYVVYVQLMISCLKRTARDLVDATARCR